MTRAVPNTASPSLYETDEIAWLERMSRLAAGGDHEQIDWSHLAEYLSDMAISERREVSNRLKVLILHLLKWEYQQAMRCDSWESTIDEQRDQLFFTFDESQTLRQHAMDVLEKAYGRAVAIAAKETKLPMNTFPPHCPWSLEQVLGEIR